MIEIKKFEREDISNVIEFEEELRRQEPDTYYWNPDEKYVSQLQESFENLKFNTAISFLAIKGDRGVGRIDASVLTSRSDASCYATYLDWICDLKAKDIVELDNYC